MRPTRTRKRRRRRSAVDAEAGCSPAEEAANAGRDEQAHRAVRRAAGNRVANEIIEVKVVAYTEQGVVVDLGGKTEGLIPASEFTETEVPRPDPNSTIEVQRTGETKDNFVIVSYQKVLRRRTWEKIDAQFKAKETITAKVVIRIKGGLVVDIGVRAFLPGSQVPAGPDAKPGRVDGPGSAGARHQAEPPPRQCGGQPPRAA